jgi:4,5-DOPA dioxygenase extradiol
MARPKTIHDFYGFPDELFAVEYPVPGDPDLAQEIAEVAKPTWIGQDRDSWGIDHGSWSVLVHAFPEAAVPVVQLSINAQEPLDYHFDLGAKLAPLRSRGVMIMGSGNVVHNLRRVDWSQPEGGYDWARRFDSAARAHMTTSPAEVLALRDHANFHDAVPTAEHFLPLVYLAGLAAATDSSTDVLVDGYTYGSLSMTSYTLDAPTLDAPRRTQTSHPGAAAPLPDPDVVPADDTNI